MKTQTTFYCEREGCERHASTTAEHPAAGVRMTVDEPNGSTRLWFCNPDCAMQWLATIPPPEVIEMGAT